MHPSCSEAGRCPPDTGGVCPPKGGRSWAAASGKPPRSQGLARGKRAAEGKRTRQKEILRLRAKSRKPHIIPSSMSTVSLGLSGRANGDPGPREPGPLGPRRPYPVPSEPLSAPGLGRGGGEACGWALGADDTSRRIAGAGVSEPEGGPCGQARRTHLHLVLSDSGDFLVFIPSSLLLDVNPLSPLSPC